MAYHNLCTLEKPPPAIGKLLGLGLKFCIQNKNHLMNYFNKVYNALNAAYGSKIFSPKTLQILYTIHPLKTRKKYTINPHGNLNTKILN